MLLQLHELTAAWLVHPPSCLLSTCWAPCYHVLMQTSGVTGVGYKKHTEGNGVYAGASDVFATDRTAQKVAAFQQSNFKLPPALDELERFLFHHLSAKLPVTDSFYNGLVAQNDALKGIIER